jgi:hypothetical protein
MWAVKVQLEPRERAGHMARPFLSLGEITIAAMSFVQGIMAGVQSFSVFATQADAVMSP